MKAYAVVFGYFCINLAIWTLGITGILTTTREPIADPNNMGSLFSLDAFTVITGIVGGGVIGILTMITRSYALSTGVLILWIVGIVIKPIRDVFIGLPLLVNSLLAGTGVVASVVSQIAVGFAALMFFVFIVEIIAGRDIS